MTEKRVDPENGVAYSYDEFVAFQKASSPKSKHNSWAIDGCWEECLPVEEGKAAVEQASAVFDPSTFDPEVLRGLWDLGQLRDGLLELRKRQAELTELLESERGQRQALEKILLEKHEGVKVDLEGVRFNSNGLRKRMDELYEIMTPRGLNNDLEDLERLVKDECQHLKKDSGARGPIKNAPWKKRLADEGSTSAASATSATSASFEVLPDKAEAKKALASGQHSSSTKKDSWAPKLEDSWWTMSSKDDDSWSYPSTKSTKDAGQYPPRMVPNPILSPNGKKEDAIRISGNSWADAAEAPEWLTTEPGPAQKLDQLIGQWEGDDGSWYAVSTAPKKRLTVEITRKSGKVETRIACIGLYDDIVFWGNEIQLTNVSKTCVTWKGKHKTFQWRARSE